MKAYPIKLRERMANIPIPLRPSDRDNVLQLQPLVDDYYRDAFCDRTNYQQALFPPLSVDDTAWGATLFQTPLS